MGAIIRRELSSYFSSAIGYIFIAVFHAFAGLYFLGYCLANNSSSLTSVFGSMFNIVLFLIPVLTMRLWSEDKKQKTDQALFTAPVKLLPITLGKYFAALIVFAIGLGITVIFALIISFYVSPDWAVVLDNLLGLFLLGASLIAIGMFISSLTENQVIAAVGGFAIGLFIMLMDSVANMINVTFISNIISSLSFNTHYTNFTVGILNLSDAVFFLSVITVFVFLTVRVFEKRRWS